MDFIRIVVSFGPQDPWDIYGEKETLSKQYLALKDALRAPAGDRDGSWFFELVGTTHPSDSPLPQRLLLKLEDVRAVSIEEFGVQSQASR